MDSQQQIEVVGLVVHGGRAEARAAAMDVAKRMAAAEVTVVACADDGWEWGDLSVRPAEGFGDGLDLVVVLGGDGTFLRAAYMVSGTGTALLGINLGRLGFLPDIEVADLPAALERLLTGGYQVEERMALTVEVVDRQGAVVGRSWALNEASVERTAPERLVHLEVIIGETSFATVPADAMIVATPTGSTAYAFSAGGPIVSPLVDAFLLTPVAPHSLFARSLVVDPAEPLSVRPLGAHGGCAVSLDGRESIVVPPGGLVRIRRSDLPVRMARLEPFDFYTRVRHKFNL